ncbi:MAG TPA: redoxin family protein [Pyrinomonadaceae bacterium]|jgi:thiol-disulfide isomerase/thioredoxin/tetratricopeptide (TPR) repeat protein|nr:redoxin family protein [Pyrinomonadaceae bacterium]
MTREFSCRRKALSLLPLLCLLLVPTLTRAQAAAEYCEPTPVIKAELKKVSDVNDESLPYAARLDRQKKMLQDLLSRYPNDFFVQRRYQDSRRAGFFADIDALVADSRAQLEKKPNDPVAVYLYARVLVGRQTKEAIALAEKLTQQSPEFPWSHLQLAEIYNYPNFRDVTKSKDHLKQWIAKCPNERASFNLVSRVGDKDMMTAAVQRLRPMLESSTDNQDLYYWDNLWTLQFKLRPVPEHPQLRQEIAEDVKKIRARNLNTKEWLQTLEAGYRQMGDKAGEHWAEDELVRRAPQSDTAKFIVQSRDDEEHPFPKPEDPEAKKQAYYRARLETTSQWITRWPDDERSWASRLYALQALNGSKNEDMEAAYNGYAKAHASQGFYLSTPPLDVMVARFYLQRGFHLEKVPALIQKALAEMERREKSGGVSDLFKRGEDVESNLAYTQSEAWPLLAEAYARTRQPAKANEVLAEMAAALKKREPGEDASDSNKRSYAYHAGIYWVAVAKVADVEKRKLDALTAYQTAMAVRVKGSPIPDELNNDTQRLWKELGGTDQGWRAFQARLDSKSKFESAEVATWDTKNTVLPEFDLTDLDGRKWTLADLKGKVAFINLWATWCGPCRMELPYVQKLREQLKDRKDVLVLTLNIDEQVGKVEPFMKENKYSFPVLLGQAFAEAQGVSAIPRNWVVTVDGKVMFEGVGFDNDGEGWMKKAAEIIEKVKGTN